MGFYPPLWVWPKPRAPDCDIGLTSQVPQGTFTEEALLTQARLRPGGHRPAPPR